MKLFVSQDKLKGFISDKVYNWIGGESILMFGQFQSKDNESGKDVGMCSIETRKFTTHITVKDLMIPKYFVLELMKDSIEKSMECVISDDGNYSVIVDGKKFDFNIHLMLEELLLKASAFEVGDNLICRGRTLRRVWNIDEANNADIDVVTIPKSDFIGEDNLGQCECGNWTHQSYLLHDDCGASTCPSCQQSYMEEILKKMTILVKEIADPELSNEDISKMIKKKYCEIYGIDDMDLDDEYWANLGE